MAGQCVELPQYSMFAQTPVYSVEGEIVFGLMQPAVVPHDSDGWWQVTSVNANRLDIIANMFFELLNCGGFWPQSTI